MAAALAAGHDARVRTEIAVELLWCTPPTDRALAGWQGWGIPPTRSCGGGRATQPPSPQMPGRHGGAP